MVFRLVEYLVIKSIVDGEALGDVTTLEDPSAVEEVKRTVEAFRALYG